MAQSHLFAGLRERLGGRLRQVIGNPVIERKELAAFDIVVGRRQVLHGSGLAAVTALVAAGTPPTMWGRQDAELAVDPAAVGLTQAEQVSVSVTAAVALSVGSETFQGTIYAQQVVSAEAVNTHAVVEGARGQLRLQSDLETDDPQESAFLDTDYHYGNPELIQLEQDGSGAYELVHYYHPWGARTDGAKTDGLQRKVVIPAGVMRSPKKVLTITGTYTNRFVPASGAQASQIAYGVFVEDTYEDAFGGGFLAIGNGVLNVEPPYAGSQDYPLQWSYWDLIFFNPFVPEDTDLTYVSCDKYTSAAYGDSATYDAALATEHIVLHFDNADPSQDATTWVLSLIDTGDPEALDFQVATLPTPESSLPASRWHVVDIDWDPTDSGAAGVYLFSSITLATSAQNSGGDLVNATATFLPSVATVGDKRNTSGVKVTFWPVNYAQPTRQSSRAVAGPRATEAAQFDFSTLRCVHTLFSIEAAIPSGQLSWGQRPYRIVLATFDSATLALFVLQCTSGNQLTFQICGLFPVALPDSAALGTITNVAGGVSKFGGFRFVVSDENGNAFVLRQQRLANSNEPYPPAIYGQFTRTGEPRTSDTWGGLYYDPPTSTSAQSPLQDLEPWVDTLSPKLGEGYAYQEPAVYNLLLNTLVGFGTDDSNLVQGTWLGSQFKAAYALSRFGMTLSMWW